MAYRYNPDLPLNSYEISSRTQSAYEYNTVNLEGLVWFSTQKAKLWQIFMYLASNTLLFHGRTVCNLWNNEWTNDTIISGINRINRKDKQICAIFGNLDCTNI